MNVLQLIDGNGRPIEKLLALAEIFEIKHDGTVAGLNQAFQKSFYQESNLNYKILDNTPIIAGRIIEVALEIFRDLGIIEEIWAPESNYDYSLLLGGKIKTVRKRLDFLYNQERSGVRFRKLVLLGNDRQLSDAEIDPDILFKPQELPFKDDYIPDLNRRPSIESEMMKIVFEQSRLPNWNLHLIETPGEYDKKQNRIRPANTQETVESWLQQTGITMGKCLVVSSQPYITHQKLAVVRGLGEKKDDFKIHICGYGAPIDIPINVYLDTIAKWFYEEILLLQKV